MPESVTDRLTCRYELVFLLVRSRRYYFNLDAIRQPLARPDALAEGIIIGGQKGRHVGVGAAARRSGHTVYGGRQAAAFAGQPSAVALRPTGGRHTAAHPRGKNPGDVWSIPTRPLRAAYYAAFPIDLPDRCIAAGCPPGGLVLDPFSGAGTTGLAAIQRGAQYLGVDLNPDFHRLAIDRILRQTHHASGPDDGRTADADGRIRP